MEKASECCLGVEVLRGDGDQDPGASEEVKLEQYLTDQSLNMLEAISKIRQ